ncbi:MAG: sugar phosphate nucleotidyltransferase [Bacteroidota bacterium]
MKIIIPMAGRGSRLRPHTLTIPKPLLPIAGKPIVQRIVEDLSASVQEGIEEVAFIIGDFGQEAEEKLQQIAKDVGAKCSIYYQEEPLGPAHAIQCAKDSLDGPCVVAFADTLFRADFSFDTSADGIIWVQKVEDPSSFGVVKTDADGIITDFVEKSPVFVSDMAIVGIYFVKQATQLRDTIQHMLDNQITDKGEFQITTALELLKQGGTRFEAGQIDEWLDCGNKDNVISTHKRILEIKQDQTPIASSARIENATIIPPCYIGENVLLRNTVVGPCVSIGNNSIVEHSVIVNSVVQDNTKISNALLENSMIGNLVEYKGKKSDISLGDYSKYII